MAHGTHTDLEVANHKVGPSLPFMTFVGNMWSLEFKVSGWVEFSGLDWDSVELIYGESNGKDMQLNENRDIQRLIGIEDSGNPNLKWSKLGSQSHHMTVNNAVRTFGAEVAYNHFFLLSYEYMCWGLRLPIIRYYYYHCCILLLFMSLLAPLVQRVRVEASLRFGCFGV